MNEQILIKIFQDVKFDLVIAAFLALLAYYIIEWIRSQISNFIEYRRFLSNKYVGLGVMVRVNGFSGRIKFIQKDEITIAGDDGFMVIPISRWRYFTWIFLKTKAEFAENLNVSNPAQGLTDKDK